MEEIRCAECVYPRVTDPCCIVEGSPLCHTHGVSALADMNTDERRAWFKDLDNWYGLTTTAEAFGMVRLAELEGLCGPLRASGSFL